MCRSNTLPLRALAGALALSFSLSCGSLGEREARLYQSGLEARRAERWEDAIRLLSRVLEQSPSDRDSLLNRGVSRYHVRDLSGAKSDLKAAVGQIGDREALHEALYFLARSRIDRIRLLLTDPDRSSWAIQKETSAVLNDALLNLKEASRIRQTYETHLWSGYCHSSLQSYDAALRETEQCERINPDRLEHDMVQAMIYERASGGARIPKDNRRGTRHS